MRTKKAIAGNFKAGEAIVSLLDTSTVKKGRYKLLNTNGEYETIHLETSANQVIENLNRRFVSDSEKTTWNNKMDRGGSLSQDFSARTINLSNAILPSKDGVDIGSATNRFRSIYVDEAYLSTNTLYIGDVPILGTNDDTVIIKADPNQSITMQTRATGITKVISEAGVQLSTSGMNANVVLQATGENSQVNIGSTGATNINAANLNIAGNTTFKSNLKAEKDLTVAGNLTVTGASATLSTSNLIIKDSLIEINNGESGSGVTAGKAGLRINRGDADAFNIVFDETDDSLKVGQESSLKTIALQEWVTSNTARPNHTHSYLPLSGGNLTGNLTINSNAVYHTGNKPTANEIGAASTNHTHNYLPLSGGTVTGPVKILGIAADESFKVRGIQGLSADGTTNDALYLNYDNDNPVYINGDKKVYHEGYKPTPTDIGAASTNHNHSLINLSSEAFNSGNDLNTYNSTKTWVGRTTNTTTNRPADYFTVLNVGANSNANFQLAHSYNSSSIFYVRGRHDTSGDYTPWAKVYTDKNKPTPAEIGAADSNHTHNYRPNTWVPTWNDVTNKPTIISINDSSTTATNQTWSAKKINDSLASKASSSHTHTTDNINGLGSAATLNAGTSANQVLKLDASGKVPISTLPSIAINETFTATDQATALSLKIEVGDIVIVTADGKTYICVDSTKTVFNDKFKPLGSATDSYTKSEVETLLNNKVDKINGKQLSTNDFTAAYKTKLDGIATGANNYVHPNDANTRHVTDAEKTTWNNKANSNHNHNILGAKSLSGQKISLDTLNLSSGSPNIAFYICASDGDGSNITGRPDDNAKNAFYLKVELIRYISSSDYVSMQTYVKHDEKIMYVRYCKTGTWTKWERIYTSEHKPSLSELGAAASSHGNHVPSVQAADARKFLRNDNTWQSLPNASTSATGIVQLTDATNSTSVTTAATPNAVKITYDLANSKASSSHGHNNLASRGPVTVEAGTTRPAVSGLSMQEVYNNSYPTDFGNVMTMRGTGDSQLLIGWSGTSGANAPAYIRSKRDQGDATWSGWAQIYTTAHKPSLTDLGIKTLTRGSYLTGSNYNGTGDVTWSVDATSEATASKIAARDSSGDIKVRLIRSNYANQNTISGAMAFRINNSGDDYIRFCSDTGAIRSFLNTYSKSETYTKTEMDNRYRQKTDMNFSDSICIITPSA